jgi:large subunit ribosomal protein L9
VDVILLQDVEKVGLRGEVVSVARGYARNFLLPRRLAEPATAGRVAQLKRVDEQRARHEARTVERAEEVAELLRKTVLRFDMKAGPTGALFGSVTPTDIADELWRTRKIRVDRRKIGIDTLKRIGRYSVPIDVFEDVRAEVKTLVVPEGGELPPEEELAAMEAAERAAAEPEQGPAEEVEYFDEPETAASEGAESADAGSTSPTDGSETVQPAETDGPREPEPAGAGVAGEHDLSPGERAPDA